MIVGDDESFTGGCGDVFDALGPGFEFGFGVEIVVAFGGWGGGIVGEPSVVATAVEADVADGRGDAFAGLDRAADDRLVDIAKADAAVVEQFVKIFSSPGGVADLDDQRVGMELIEEALQTIESLRRVVEGKRKLEQDGAEAFRVLEDIETGGGDFDVGGGDVFFVGEFAPQFRGEEETGVGGDAFEPLFGVGGLHRMVEGRIDFDGVKKFGEERGFVKIFGPRIGVEDALPVGVGPAGGADVNFRRRGGVCRWFA